jgi:hypothetical protein
MDEIKKNNYRILEVDRQFLSALFKNTRSFTIYGMPEDAELASISNDVYFERNHIGLIFRSAEWSEVPNGEEIPKLNLIIEPIPPLKIKFCCSDADIENIKKEKNEYIGCNSQMEVTHENRRIDR